VNESKPDCRAGQQRVRQQPVLRSSTAEGGQVQIYFHAAKLAHLFCVVTGKIVEWKK
jgi:hypothetical protein